MSDNAECRYSIKSLREDKLQRKDKLIVKTQHTVKHTTVNTTYSKQKTKHTTYSKMHNNKQRTYSETQQ